MGVDFRGLPSVMARFTCLESIAAVGGEQTNFPNAHLSVGPETYTNCPSYHRPLSYQDP